MNSLASKIIVVLFAVMLGINLTTPKADAVDHCMGSICSHCNWMMTPISESVLAFGSDGQMCDSSFATSPCNLNNHPEPNIKIFIVSSIKQDRQKTDGSFTFAVFGTSLLQNVIENSKRDQFQITTDTIPIYLQNLSLLC